MKKLLKIMILCLPYFFGTQETLAQPRLDFEFGNFGHWILDTGVRVDNEIIWNPRPADNLGLQIKLMSPSSTPKDHLGLDCLPIPVDLPTTFPAGRFSARLGDRKGGNNVAKISSTFTVTENATFLNYSYAIVLEDPGHGAEEQPKFVVNIKDSMGNLATCGEFEVSAGPDADNNGFIYCEGDYQILPWTTSGADLTPYIGEDITIEFMILDCSLGAHGAYAYVDASLGALKINVENLCNNGDTATLHAPEGFSEYLWSTGETTPSITIENAQYGENYSVTLISNTDCSKTIYTNLAPKSTARIDALPDEEICLGGSVFVQPKGVNVGDFRFTRPDPTNPGEYIDVAPIGASAVLSPIKNTTYTIIARNKNGCEGLSTTLKVNVINSDDPPFPKADFEIETLTEGTENICNTIQLKNLSGYCKGGLTYNWDFGDGTKSSETNPLHTFPTTNENTTYIITLTVTSADSNAIITKSVEYNTFILADFSTSKLDCETISIVNSSNICSNSISEFTPLVYSWNFGDGSPNITTSNNEPSLTHIYSKSGTYDITLTITNINEPGVIISTFSRIVRIDLETNVDFNYRINCLDVTFEDLSVQCSTKTTYIWDFGDGSPTSNQENPKHIYTTPGTYEVSLTILDGTESLSQTKEISVTTTETIPDFELDIKCDIVSFTNFTNSCDELTYTWDFGDSSPFSTEKNPTHRYDLNKTYNVTLTVNDGLKDFSISKSFTTGNGLTGYNIPQDMILCRNPSATNTPIFDLAAQKDFILRGLANNNIELPSVSFHLNAPEAFNGLRPLPLEFTSFSSSQKIYARIANQNGCVEVFMFSLNILNTPTVNLIENIHLCSFNQSNTEYDLSQLNAKIFDGIDQSNIKLSYHLFENDAVLGTNKITELNLNAGLDILLYVRSEHITDSRCFELSTFQIRMDNDDTDTNNRCMPFFANTMTPNGDGRNDTFFIKNIEKFSNNTLTIYNRWGNMVYRTTGYNNTWNGMHKGKPLPSGNYYYYFQLNDGTNRSHSGYITILR
ncbi:PKD domain-containing protein [Seonamhaeicola sediminis]|uniref:PKD domain-containing protein n=1 Tax=Seonamhaeicola sediminis TaxID=2528206 RepID=A0A562YDZ3_9FLAO|nr:PKD domain-containing protein [Seonamhaeicola sediminis]TWO32739.1 PKD domain-containing protein [Seonamhaeicola sediminis]